MAFLTENNDNSQTVYAQLTQGVNYGRRVGNTQNYELPSYPNIRGGKPSTPIPDQARLGYQAPQQPQQAPQGSVDAAHLAVDTYADQHAQSVKSPVAKATALSDADKVKSDLSKVANGEATASEVASHPWYADRAAHKGLLTAGLAIMSGANPLEAFQMASEASDKAHVGQQLQDQRSDLLKQGYSQTSIDQAISANDPGLLQKSDEYLTQQAQAKTDEQRAYNEQQQAKEWQREDQKTADERAYQEKKAGQATTEDWAKLDNNTLYNKRTGETKPLTGALTSGNQDNANLSIADRNNYIITTGNDPITGQPVKATQLKQAQDWDKGNQAYANTKAGSEEALANVNYILDPSHESDFNSAFGGVDSMFKTTRAGTAKMESALDTLKSQSFLDSIKAMRGMGSLSDAEGQKLVSAIGVLKPDMPQKALRAQVEQIKTHLNTLRRVSEQEAKRKGYVGVGESSTPNNSGSNSSGAKAGKDLAGELLG